MKKQNPVMLAIIVVVVAVIGFGGYHLYQNRTLNLANDIEVKFSGYNEMGSAQQTKASMKTFASDIVERVGRKEGLSGPQRAGMIKVFSMDESTDQNEVEALFKSDADQAKASKTADVLDDITLETGDLDGDGDLSNGDKFQVIVKVGEDAAKYGLEGGTKTFTVSGLKED